MVGLVGQGSSRVMGVKDWKEERRGGGEEKSITFCHS
jgi:hypothetical protein